MRRLIRAVLCLGLIATACSDGRATETKAGEAIRWIDVDGRTNRFNSSFLAYFPPQVTVRPGDEVVFRSVWTGEPHTVTMGRLVDSAFSGKPNRPKLPKWTFGQSHSLPPNVGRPCFLAKGAPPTGDRESCPVVEQPAFNGKQTYYSSGFLPENRRFRVKIAPDTPPKAYTFFCSFHGGKMAGTINVVDKTEDVPSQDDVDEAAKKQLREFVDGTLDEHGRTYDPYDRSRTGRFPWPALASFETRGGVVKVLEFIPFTLKARVDEEVSWSMLGAHTIAFDPPDNAKPPAIRILSTGETEIKADAVNENRSKDPPTGAPKKKVKIDAGTYRGDGFLSSGILYSPRRGLITYAVRFAEPGSYRYQCLLHPRMSGLVTVAS